MPKNTFVQLCVGLALVMSVIFLIVYLQSIGYESQRTGWSHTSKNDVLTKPTLRGKGEPVPDFAAIDNVQQKKQAYFDYLRPVAKEHNEYIVVLREYMFTLREKLTSGAAMTEQESKDLAWLVKEYRVDSELNRKEQLNTLLVKVDIIPLELVLVQSANESGWGTSRFAKEGYNFFGIWCFVKDCGFVPTQRDDGKGHEVAKFEDLYTAMYSYMRNLNRHPAYKDLRLIRSQLRASNMPIDGYKLAEGLSSYSERGADYIEELRSMIRVNKELISI